MAKTAIKFNRSSFSDFTFLKVIRYARRDFSLQAAGIRVRASWKSAKREGIFNAGERTRGCSDKCYFARRFQFPISLAMRYLGSQRTRLSVLHYQDFTPMAARSLLDALHYFAKVRPLYARLLNGVYRALETDARNVEEVDPRCRDIKMQLDS